jgi:hypothetical protein
MTSDNCPHCGAALPELRGVSCPACRAPLPKGPPGRSPRKVAGGLMMIGGAAALAFGGAVLLVELCRLGGGAGPPDTSQWATSGFSLAAGALLWEVGRWLAGPRSTNRGGAAPPPRAEG